MAKIKNKIGMKFGKLTVVSLDGRKSKRTYWVCRCDCGEVTTARGDKLITGQRISCGCALTEKKKSGTGGRRPIHGMTNTRFYAIWKSMKQRCLNVNNKDYARYGGRGIRICDEWMTFENFKNDMLMSYEEHLKLHGEKDTSIDRINTSGDYTRNNSRWATQLVQQQNRTNNKTIHFKGKDYIVSDLARIFNLKPATLFNRLNCGWNLDKSLHTPIKIAK